MAVITRETGGRAGSLSSLLAYYGGRVRRQLRLGYLGIATVAAGLVWFALALGFYLGLLPARALLALAITFVFPVLALAAAWLRRPSARGVAHLLDSRLDNRQRVVTSLELLGGQELPPMSRAQMASTERMLGSVHPDEIYPVRVPAGQFSLGAGLVAVALGLFFLKEVGGNFSPIDSGNLALGAPTPSALLSPTPQPGLPDSQKQQNGQKQDGNNVNLGMNPEDAQRKAEASQRAQDALDRLKSALDEQSATQGAADSLRQGQYDQAANQLKDLGSQNDQLSDAAKQGIGDALQRAANDPSSTPDLQNAEQKAADALQNGDYKDINSAMQGLGDALRKTAGDVVPQQQLAQGFPQQAQGQQDNSNSGQNGQNGQSAQQGQGNGQQNQGSQSGQNGDQAQNGDGSGSSSQGNQGQGQNGQGQGSQGNGGGADNGQNQGKGQSGGSGKGQSRVTGPADYNPQNVQGNPFELQGKGDPSQAVPGDPSNQPGLTLQGNSSDGSASLPPEQGGPVTAPGETNHVPVERWDVIQKYFSHEK